MVKLFSPHLCEAARTELARYLDYAPRDTNPGQWAGRARAALASLLSVPPQWVLLTSSCTAALHLAWVLLERGRQLSVEAPVLTWPSTYSYAPDKTLVDTNQYGWPVWSERTDVLRVVVALWGRPIPAAALPQAEGPLVLDAAHYLGYGVDLLRSSQVDAVCYSFDARKEAQVFAGGALVCPNLTAEVVAACDSGTLAREGFVPGGLNYKMHPLSTALLPAQLEHHKRRGGLYRTTLLRAYQEGLRLVPGEFLTGPDTASGHVAVFRFNNEKDRRVAVGALLKEDIETSLHYPLPLWKPLRDTLGALDLTRRIVSLPIHLNLTEQTVDQICTIIRKALNVEKTLHP